MSRTRRPNATAGSSRQFHAMNTSAGAAVSFTPVAIATNTTARSLCLRRNAAKPSARKPSMNASLCAPPMRCSSTSGLKMPSANASATDRRKLAAMSATPTAPPSTPSSARTLMPKTVADAVWSVISATRFSSSTATGP